MADDEAPKIATTTGKKSTPPSTRKDKGPVTGSVPSEKSGKFSDKKPPVPKPERKKN
jgi:hypothetical protein